MNVTIPDRLEDGAEQEDEEEDGDSEGDPAVPEPLPPVPSPEKAGVRVLVNIPGVPIASGILVEAIEEHGTRTTAITDDKGCAWFEVEAGTRVLLSAHHADFLAAGDEARAPGPGGIVSAYLRFAPGTKVEGLVVSAADGTPVPEATVDVYDDTFFRGCCPSNHGALPARATATTDHLGRFRIPMPREYSWTLIARARGFGPEVLSGHANDSKSDFTLRLSRGAALRGSVSDAAGDPVPGARVFVLPREALDIDPRLPAAGFDRSDIELEQGWFMNSADFERSLSGGTDVDGRYEIHGLAPGVVYHAYATAPGRAMSCIATGIVAETEDGETLRDFRLRSLTALSVEVLVPHGQATSTVDIEVDTGGIRRRATSKGSAVFFDSLDPGEAELHLSGPGLVSTEVSVTLEEGAIQAVSVAMERKPEIDPPDPPQDGSLRLRGLRPEGTRGNSTFAWHVTDGQGREHGSQRSHLDEGSTCEIEVDNLGPGQVHLEFWVEGLIPVAMDFPLEPGEAKDLGDIPLERGRVLFGRVFDDAGEPVSDESVELVLAGDRMHSNPIARRAPDGSFYFAGVPPGPVTLRTGGELHDGTEVRIDPVPGEPIVLTVVRSAFLEATVADAAGHPQQNVTLSILVGGRAYEMTTGEDGRLLHGWNRDRMNLPAGPCEVFLERHGLRVSRGTVVLEKGELTELSLEFPRQAQ